MQGPTPARGALGRFLAIVERGGNALPHPATLFALMAFLIVLVSAVAAQLELSAVHPGTGKPVTPVSLLTIAGLHRIMTEMVTNFTSFAPLGTVLVAMLGIAVAEGSGLIAAVPEASGAVGSAPRPDGGRRVRRHHVEYRRRGRLRAAGAAGRHHVPERRAPSARRHGCRIRRRVGRLQRQPAARHRGSAARGALAGGGPHHRPWLPRDPGGELLLHGHVDVPAHGPWHRDHRTRRRAAAGPMVGRQRTRSR